VPAPESVVSHDTNGAMRGFGRGQSQELKGKLLKHRLTIPEPVVPACILLIQKYNPVFDLAGESFAGASVQIKVAGRGVRNATNNSARFHAYNHFSHGSHPCNQITR